jgi:hypothetical protein
MMAMLLIVIVQHSSKVWCKICWRSSRGRLKNVVFGRAGRLVDCMGVCLVFEDAMAPTLLLD